jgi:ubiquinone/menaquinone biosynthesis C-methylase UbiE
MNNQYPLSNDDEEISRLHSLHFLAQGTFGANVLAPINPDATTIVDVGAGSGRWAIEVAQQFDKTKVIGIDLSPVRPAGVPENCEFRLADLTTGLNFPDESVDLIHSRYGC